MADFVVYFTEASTGNQLGSYRPTNLSFSIRNSEPGDISGEISLATPGLTFEQFGPYRTDYHLWRTGQSGTPKLLVEGMVTSVNLNGDRDTILWAGKDWLHYLQRRVYPFDPVQYIAGDWDKWPVGWPHFSNTTREMMGDPVEVRDIIEDMLEAMESVTLPALPGGVPAGPGLGQLGLVYNNIPTGKTTKYTIYPGDETTIFDHITTLSDQVEGGFEFDILPGSREFKMWSPDRTQFNPVYSLEGQLDNEIFGAFIELDWTNDGPDGTFLVGLGTSGKKVGRVWYYRPSIETYRWLDKIYDFGDLKNADLILNLLKDQQDLYPQRKLGLTLLNPEFLAPSLYTADRPRSVIGQKVFVAYNFPPYWTVDSTYRINALNWQIDGSTNEAVGMELEIIYEES